ncbi:hypothetical protein PV325_011706 [Microctonus aethiopoides]|nr:hypothetical protein PV325_011706 [Microctonus aethiopoides]
MTLVNVNIHRPSEFGVSMCTTEMTEGYSMSPSTASSSGTNSGCLGSPINRMTPSISSPGKARETRETRNEMEDEDEISVGCPSPLPLVVATTLQDDDDDERLSSSREEYSERLTPRSYLDDDERYCSRDAVEYSLTPNIRLTSTRTDQGINSHSPDDNGDDDERLGNGRGGAADDYFKPLKRLKMVPIQQSDDEDERDRDSNERGVKSFSILDILSHRPKAKIVRPWDTNESSNHERNPLHQQQQQQQSRQQLHHHSLAHSTARDLSLMSMSLVSMSGSMSEPPLSSSSSSGRSSVSDSDSPDPLTHHHLHHHHHHHHQHHSSMHHNLHSGIHHSQMQHQLKRKSIQQQHNSQGGQNSKRSTGQGSPLDALFQMTSKTFDAGEHSQELQKPWIKKSS